MLVHVVSQSLWPEIRAVGELMGAVDLPANPAPGESQLAPLQWHWPSMLEIGRDHDSLQGIPLFVDQVARIGPTVVVRAVPEPDQADTHAASLPDSSSRGHVTGMHRKITRNA